jgi:peroxiredoxin
MSPHRPTLRRLAARLGAVAGLSLFAATAVAVDVGERAPDFELRDLAGREVTLASLRGRVVLVDFWASWCEPCAREMPLLQRLHEQYQAQGFTVVGVSIDNDAANIRRFLERHRVTFPILHDPGPRPRVAGAFGLPAMPTSYLIDRNGIVRYRQAGYRANEGPRLEQQVRALVSRR